MSRALPGESGEADGANTNQPVCEAYRNEFEKMIVIVSICIYPGLCHWIKVVAVTIRLVNC